MEWADGFWFKAIFVVCVVIAQGLLWSWVFIRRRQVVPEVRIFNFRELYDLTRAAIDRLYRRREV
jgi:uncharacterized membrane protein YbhN (UPF0104 family)